MRWTAHAGTRSTTRIVRNSAHQAEQAEETKIVPTENAPEIEKQRDKTNQDGEIPLPQLWSVIDVIALHNHIALLVTLRLAARGERLLIYAPGNQVALIPLVVAVVRQP